MSIGFTQSTRSPIFPSTLYYFRQHGSEPPVVLTELVFFLEQPPAMTRLPQSTRHELSESGKWKYWKVIILRMMLHGGVRVHSGRAAVRVFA